MISDVQEYLNKDAEPIPSYGDPATSKCQIGDCEFESVAACTFSWVCYSRKGCNRRFCLKHKGFPGYTNKNQVVLCTTTCSECEPELTKTNLRFWCTVWFFLSLMILLGPISIIVTSPKIHNYQS